MSKKDCVHHWQIETADGPISKGKCQKCNKVGQFENSIYMTQLHITVEKDLSDARRKEKDNIKSWHEFVY